MTRTLLAAQPGQFVMVEQPGFSPVPISVSRVADGALWLTIRAAGAATQAVTALQPGTQVGLRGAARQRVADRASVGA